LVNSLIPPAYGTGMPPSDVGGNGGYSVVSSSGFSFMPNGLPQVNQPGQPGSAGVGTATGLEVGGNVNYFTTPGASIGNAARMPVVSGGVDGTAGGANATIGNTGGTYVADVNMESMPGASVTGAGFGIPECHNPLAGGVPLLPDVSAVIAKLCVFSFTDRIDLILRVNTTAFSFKYMFYHNH